VCGTAGDARIVCAVERCSRTAQAINTYTLRTFRCCQRTRFVRLACKGWLAVEARDADLGQCNLATIDDVIRQEFYAHVIARDRFVRRAAEFVVPRQFKQPSVRVLLRLSLQAADGR
jgi:hypothetical protein